MRYMTTTEAAAKLHVDPSRVRLLCLRGRINTMKVGKTYAIAEDELAQLRRSFGRRVGRGRRPPPRSSWPMCSSSTTSLIRLLPRSRPLGLRILVRPSCP